MRLLVQKTIFTLFLATCIIKSYGQIGINTDDPDTSAILDIRADKKGVLFPRIDQGDIDDLQKQEKDALFYYNNDTKRFYYYNASKSNWQCINPLNSTDPSQITAPNNLKVNSDLTVKNNQTVKNKLTVESSLDVNSVLEAKQTEIVLKEKVDLNNSLSIENNLTVENGNVDVNSGNIDVKSGQIKGRGSVPIGTIVMWNGGTIPDGWEKCDGGSANGIDIPDLSDRFIVAGDNSSPGGKIAYRDHKYTSEPANCETERYTYYLQKPHPGHDGGTMYTTVDANSLTDAKSKATGSGWSKRNDVSPNPEDNDEYYINNPNCTVDKFTEQKTFKLIFIIRVK
jgi:hypothetical protein